MLHVLVFVVCGCVTASALSIVANHTQSRLQKSDASFVKPVDINPIHYLHVPQTGSTLANAVAHMACGSDINQTEIALDPDWFLTKHQAECNRSRFLKFESGHDALKLKDAADVEHVVMMVRNPAQRVLSGYYHDLHDCWELRRQFNCKVRDNGEFKCDGDDLSADFRFVRNPNLISPVEYGKCVENCTANMLTGRDCGASGEVDVQHAMGIVNKIGFVGLAEEWGLSMCLWHRRFGGRLLNVELENAKQGIQSASMSWIGRHDEQLLGDWRPAADTLVYNAAVRRFWEEVSTYGIDRSLCESEMFLAQTRSNS
jgi:hypothetical protein